MFAIALKNVWSKKARLVSLLAIIVIGVGFTSGVLVLTDTIGKTFDGLFGDVYRNTDAVVRNKAAFASDFGSVRDRLDGSVIDLVKAVPSVKVVEGAIQFNEQALDKNGKTIGGNGPPAFGFNWIQIEELNPYQLVAGSAPAGPTDVVIDKLIAKKGPYAVGDQIHVLGATGNETFTVTGIAKFGTADSAAGSTALQFTDTTAGRLAQDPGRFDEFFVAAKSGVSETSLRNDIAKSMTGNVEVLTAKARSAESANEIKKALSFFNTFLLVFALIAVFVGMFVIYNTFSILIAQRSREMALMRAIGASAAQVRRSVVMESVVIGLIGSVLGIAFGLAMATLLKAALSGFGIDLPANGLVLAPRTVVVALLVGVGTTVASAYFPARKAAKIPPLAALRDVAFDRTGGSRRRTVIGVAMMAASAVLLIAGLTSIGIAAVGGAFVLAVLGVAVIGPVIARPISRFIGAPLPSARGVTGTLARENASRNPRRTSSTALALTIGVALVSGILVMASSLKTSLNSTIDKQFTGDFVVSPKSQGGPSENLSPQVATQIRSVGGVGSVTAARFNQAKVADKVTSVAAIDAAAVGTSLDLGKITGSFAGINGDGIAISKKKSESSHLNLGSTVHLSFAKGAKDLNVVAIYDKADVLGPYTIGLATYDAGYLDNSDTVVFVKLASGASAATTKTSLEQLLQPYPSVQLQDRTEFKQTQANQINQLLGLIYVLLALAIVIALTGIANTLSLSIFERRRELGILRAVGQARSQTRASVRWESAIIAVFGTLLGLAVGVGFGVAIVKALADQGVNTLSIPVGGIVAITIVAALAGVIASLRPAWRAAKLNVLTAIASE